MEMSTTEQTSMQTTARIREQARELLAAGQVDLFLGYKQGSNPLRAAPHTITSVAQADQLIWNLACINNLVPTLRQYAGQRVGLVVKGCDSRALAELLKLHQLRREDLYIIGLPCDGMLDPQKLRQHCDLNEIESFVEEDDQIHIYTEDDEQQSYERAPLLFNKCQSCATPTPVLYDTLLEGKIAPASTSNPASVAPVALVELENLTTEQRFAYWSAQLNKCTLCYACQTICPLCFCKQCNLTLPRNDPKRKARSRAEVFSFHLMRAYHMTGRCIGCYECERVCPVDIPLSTIFQKVQQETHALFNYTAGQPDDTCPPLSCFANPERST